MHALYFKSPSQHHRVESMPGSLWTCQGQGCLREPQGTVLKGGESRWSSTGSTSAFSCSLLLCRAVPQERLFFPQSLKMQEESTLKQMLVHFWHSTGLDLLQIPDLSACIRKLVSLQLHIQYKGRDFPEAIPRVTHRERESLSFPMSLQGDYPCNSVSKLNIYYTIWGLILKAMTFLLCAPWINNILSQGSYN